MTTVMSKLRDFSEWSNIPLPYMTRTISGAIVALYAVKVSYPYVENFLNQNSMKKGRKIRIDKHHHHRRSSTFSKRNDLSDISDLVEEQSLDSCGNNLDSTSGYISDEDSANDQSTTTNQKRSSKNRSKDNLVRIINGGNQSSSVCNQKERYLEFGPQRSSKILIQIEELLVRFLFEIRNITGINVDFVVQLVKLVRIMIPRMASMEVFILVMHTLSLISRTFLSIYVASLEGRVIKFIVQRDLVQFSKLMIKWLLISVPATFLNSLIRFLESKLALSFRSRLVNYAYGLYFRNEAYYSVSNLDGRLENADHCLTDDIATFSRHCAHMYSHVTKPMLDVAVVLFTLFQMGRRMGSHGIPGPLLGIGVVFSTHLILRRFSPQFGKLVSEEARQKGYLRFVHSRLITNAEEIAFYRGGHIEKSILEKAYRSLTRQMNLIFKQRLWYVMLEQLLMKYLWSATGLVVIATPIMLSGLGPKTLNRLRSTSEEVSDRTEYMMTAKNILLSGSDAMERLLSSYKELTELVGYTNRVARMFTVFEEVGNGQFKRSTITNKLMKTSDDRLENDENQQIPFNIIINKNGVPQMNGQVVIVHDFIKLSQVPIVTPNCDIVVPSLSITITRNMHLLITGPNGCGKSSLFRIMAGLWPVFNGKLERPQTRDMFYIPQRPYMSLGTIRDQLIYPDSMKTMMQDKGVTDKDLEKILEMVNLKSIILREGSWNAKGDWKDILSGGEKQRLGMARLFYHRPKFALLDECTSAVSIDTEAKMYETAKELGITLITITHRPSLWRFHTHLLRLDGEGGWRIENFDSNHQESEI